MNKKLTRCEQNLIKDVLRAIGQDDELEKQFARSAGMRPQSFSRCANLIYLKLGNGRVTTQDEKTI